MHKALQRKNGIRIAAAFASLVLPALGHADVTGVANGLRTGGCGRVSAQAPLSSDPRLVQAAQSVSRGMSPHNAARAAGYQATNLASIHLAGYARDADFKGVLGKNYCKTLSQRDFRNIGVAQRGGETWILLGAALTTPDNPQQAASRALELVNAARSRPRRCGGQSFSAAGPLKLNAVLNKAALAHSQEMAKYAYMEHTGRDGSTPAQRISAAGYSWSHAGENIAAGPGTAEDVVAGWLKSPGHCANIMSPKFAEMGIAYALSKDDYGIYWTQTFGAPR